MLFLTCHLPPTLHSVLPVAMSFPSSPARGSPSSPAYRKGVAFGQPGWKASRASRGRASWVESPLQHSPRLEPSRTARRSDSYLTVSAHGTRSPSPVVQSKESTRSSTPLSALHDVPKQVRKRFIRKTPFLQRVQQWPFDTYYQLSAYLSELQDDIFADQGGNFTGGLLHCLALLALFLSPDSSLGSWFMNKPAYRKAQNPAIAYEYLINNAGDEFAMADALKRHARRSAVHQASDGFFRVVSIVIFVVVFTASCANAYTFFSRKRTYSFYQQSKQETVLGSTTSIGFDSPNVKRKEGVRELHMWDPDTYSAKLFATFSPAHAAVYPAATFVRMNLFSWLVFAFLLTAISVPVHLILHLYQQLVKDKSLVQAAVLTEYNDKYVYPKAMPVVRDQSTQTT